MSHQMVSGRVERILASLSGFFSAVSDPGLRHLSLDPETCDFTFGNPQELASPDYVEALRHWAEPLDEGWFAYKMGHYPAQEAAAQGLRNELGVDFHPDDILACRGAHGGLCAALFVAVDEGDEVIYLSPPWFFYEAMILAAGGIPVKVKLAPQTFDLDLDAIGRAITARTRVLLINTPHNPTGRIFPAESLQALAGLLEDASLAHGRPIYIISDEAYSRILFDGNRMVSPGAFYACSFLVHTYSKSALAPGQRLGYVALPSGMPGREEIRRAFAAAGLGTGNWLPDAIMLYALRDIERVSIDLAHLQAKRDRMVRSLREMGYRLHVPEGTFYLLARSPIEDDRQLARRLAADKVLVMPGSMTELPGYFRVSLTATDDMIDRALPVFAGVMQECRTGGFPVS